MKYNNVRTTVSSILVFVSIAVAPLAFAAPQTTTPVKNTPAKQSLLSHTPPSNKKFDSSKRRGFGGTVTAINGTTITITSIGKNPQTYTIDASHAHTLSTGRKLADVSTIKIGDTISAVGIINGTSILAQTVIVRPANSGVPKSFAAFHKTKTTH